MMLVNRFIAALLLSAACVLPQVQASTIAVLDAQAALQMADATKAFRAQLIEQTAGEEKAVADLERQARELQEKLRADAQNQQLQMQFQKLFAEYQRQGKALQQKRAEQEQKFIAQMRPKLDAVILKLIEERKLDQVLNRQALVYAAPESDITAEVVKRLNAAN